MIDTTKSLKHLHAVYCTLSGHNYPWTVREMWRWEPWSARFTEADLRLVLNFLKRGVAQGVRRKECLTFRNVVEDTYKFSDALAEAQSEARLRPKPRPHPARAVLAATHRPDPTPQPAARSAGDVIRGQAELAKLLQLRDSL